MDLLFAVVIVLYLIVVPGKAVDGRIVSLEGKPEIEQAIKEFNCTNPKTEVFLARSVGTHGRYKNIGFDYECLHRPGQMPNEYEHSKGLRRYDGEGYSFLYWESEATQPFINYLKALNSSVDHAYVLSSSWRLGACHIGKPSLLL